jgi:hypothetical protein
MKMQIIIVQSEIETAIRNLILSQLSVKEGMRIDIELSATRGADGFKATIDIVPDNSPAKALSQEPEAQPTTMKTVASVASASITRQPPVDNAHVAEGAEKFPESTAGAAAEAGPATSASAEPSSTEPVTGEAPAAPSRSLFAGLKKPVNQAAA